MTLSDATREISLEQLRETMVDLERARRHERQLRFESEGLLEGLQALNEAQDTGQVFDNLSRVMRRFVPFEEAFMLLATGAEELRPVRATSSVFEGLTWRAGDMLHRVRGGQIVCVFDVGQVPEWQEQPTAVRARVRSVIHAPLRTETMNAVLVFVHSRPAIFTADHVRLLERFAPLGNQALVSIEYRQRLEERARELCTANEMLETTHLQLLQSEKLASIGQLAAGVAHEINNPIGYVCSNVDTLKGYLDRMFEMLAAYQAAESMLSSPALAATLRGLREQLELEFLRKDIPSLMRETKDGIVRVRQIVQDLRDFSRGDSKQDWQLSKLHQGIDSTLNIVGNEIKYKADVIKDYGQIPDIECLPSQLNQVIMNLAMNAAQSIGPERGKITIRTGVEGAGGEHVWIEIADTGAGIAKENLSRIFDPFFTTKPVGKGTGLGLSLSYGIVEKHRGRIEVHSEVGQGTTFRIVLPVRQGAPNHAQEGESHE